MSTIRNLTAGGAVILLDRLCAPVVPYVFYDSDAAREYLAFCESRLAGVPPDSPGVDHDRLYWDFVRSARGECKRCGTLTRDVSVHDLCPSCEECDVCHLGDRRLTRHDHGWLCEDCESRPQERYTIGPGGVRRV